MKYNIISYKTFIGSLPAGTADLDLLIGLNLPPILEWVCYNDGLTTDIQVKINDLDEDAVTIKSQEYFGGQRSVNHFYISNPSPTDAIAYRVVFKVIGNEAI